MTYVLTNAEKIRRLPWNTTLNATNSIFAQLTYFGPAFVLFLSELKLSSTQIGFLLSLFSFTGLVAPLIAPAVARFGYKRTFVTFFGIRKIITIGLLFAPPVMAQFGLEAVLLYLTVIVGGFALCRAISETGMYPWVQEFIPDSIRGRYGAINDIVARLTGIASIGVASFVLGQGAGFDRFTLLFAVALVFGFAAVWSSSHIPGGAPPRADQGERVAYGQLAEVLRDRNFLIYMAALAVLIIGTTPMGSFLPLYMEQQIGLSESQVVFLQIGVLMGGLATTYLFGWAADRYGSKPIMMSGLVVKILLPLAWMLTPRNAPLSLPLALITALINGGSDIAWAIGSGRLLYVKIVPAKKSGQYMAVYYATIGLIGGLSQIIGGRALDFTQGLSGQFLIFAIDPFFPLFVFGLLLTIISILLFHRVQGDTALTTSEFAWLFIHGNPLLALESMFRYYRARDERETLAMTERMAHTKSPLTVDELLEALYDPRFNVRFEAIISIAHMDSDPRLVKALSDFVDGTELSLSVIAAWALGRIGDEQAIEPLRQGLDSSYRSIQAHCARALGTLGDEASAPLLLERLKTETDKGLRIAYSSALGTLQLAEAIPTLLDILATTENEGARMEVALALARMIGGEHHFVRLLRQMRSDKGTAVSQAITAARRRLQLTDDAINALMVDCADSFARNDFDGGIAHLRSLIPRLPSDTYTVTGRAILEACAGQLEAHQANRNEYLLLALHALGVGVV
jgi:MFS transporter, MHS family, proline/betaine transporter